MEIDLGALLRVAAAFLPQRADPLVQLQRQAEELRLRHELGELSPQVLVVTAEEFMRDRRDVVLIGKRGSGKTAGAMALAYASGRRVYCVDWPQETLPPEAHACPFHLVPRQFGAAFIWDETALRIGLTRKSDATWETMALARQRDQSHIWTSQSAAAVALDVLRHDLTLCWLDGPSTFERSELERQAVVARGILRANQAPVGTFAANVDGQWIMCRPSLPSWWSERHSNVWRGSSPGGASFSSASPPARH